MGKIIHHTANNREFLLVEVPKDNSHYDYQIEDFKDRLHISCVSDESESFIELISEPMTGSYKVLFVADEATEEQAQEVIQSLGDEAMDNTEDRQHIYEAYGSRFYDVENALDHLIYSFFPSTPNRILILEKIN